MNKIVRLTIEITPEYTPFLYNSYCEVNVRIITEGGDGTRNELAQRLLMYEDDLEARFDKYMKLATEMIKNKMGGK